MTLKLNGTPHSACFWLIGVRQAGQRIGWAADFHAAASEIVRLKNPKGGVFDESFTGMTRYGTKNARKAKSAARRAVKRLCTRHGFRPREIIYDNDSTECFADC